MIRNLFKNVKWKDCVRTSKNIEKRTKKEEHESKVSCLKIFLTKHESTISGKIFEIK